MESNALQMARGDTYKFKFRRLDSSGDPILAVADSIYFTVKKRATDKGYVIQKKKADMTFDEDGYYHVTLNPSDTDGLDFGQYIYDIEVIVAEYKQTIAIGAFFLNAEVTYAGNE